jgi:acetyl-CoA carboxylase biotin carboxyl carrier protein
MSLTSKDVAEITRLLEDSSFTELRLELDGMKLVLRRGGHGPAAVGSTVPAAGTAPSLAPAQVPAAAPGMTPEIDAGLHAIPAPLLGTFYRAPKPGAPAFIEHGSLVEEATVIGIIEVMKLMNAVRAGVRGRVREILAADGELVEYGQTLARVLKIP